VRLPLVDGKNHGHALDILDCQLSQEDGVDESKDGSVGSDAYGERHERHQGDHAVLPDHPQGKP
jgi:hypothetical protein